MAYPSFWNVASVFHQHTQIDFRKVQCRQYFCSLLLSSCLSGSDHYSTTQVKYSIRNIFILYYNVVKETPLRENHFNDWLLTAGPVFVIIKVYTLIYKGSGTILIGTSDSLKGRYLMFFVFYFWSSSSLEKL